MREWLSRPRGTLDWVLIWLAVTYFAVVAVTDFGASIRASADAIGDGEVWTLLTSALEVDGDLPGLQLLLTALVAAAVIVREGPRLWWAVALTGHVGSALIAYAIIGIAGLLDSASADRVAADPDYGVSCVLAASLGALAVSGLTAVRRDRASAVGGGASAVRDRATGGGDGASAVRDRATGGGDGAAGGGASARDGHAADHAALAVGLIGLLALLPLSFGWYGVEHPISYVLGAAVTAIALRRRRAAR